MHGWKTETLSLGTVAASTVRMQEFRHQDGMKVVFNCFFFFKGERKFKSSLKRGLVIAKKGWRSAERRCGHGCGHRLGRDQTEKKRCREHETGKKRRVKISRTATSPDVHLRYQSCDDCLVAGGNNLPCRAKSTRWHFNAKKWILIKCSAQ